MIEQIKCFSARSGIWTRLTNDDRVGEGDVILYRTSTPVDYELKNNVDLSEKKKGISRDGLMYGLIVYDARCDGYLSSEYFVWTRAGSVRRLPLNPIFSKPLPLP